MQRLLNFTVAGTQYAAPLETASKVVPLVALQAVPNADPCIAGVMNLAGESVLVIDLAARFGLKDRKQYTLSTSIVICHQGGQMFGIVADTINGVDVVGDDSVDLSDALRPYLGVYRSAKGTETFVLDIERVLNLDLPASLPARETA